MKDDKIGKLGAALSLGCAVHCLTFPVIVPFVPFVGKDLLLSHGVEIVLLGLAVAIGLYSLVHGFVKHHRRVTAFPIFFLGLIAILAGFFLQHHGEVHKALFSFESLLLIAGGIMMGAAQVINLVFHRHSGSC